MLLTLVIVSYGGVPTEDARPLRFDTRTSAPHGRSTHVSSTTSLSPQRSPCQRFWTGRGIGASRKTWSPPLVRCFRPKDSGSLFGVRGLLVATPLVVIGVLLLKALYFKNVLGEHDVRRS